MKPSSGTLAFVRIFVWVVAIVVALGYYGHVRAQAGASQTVVIPLRPLAALSSVPVPPVFGLEGIVADKTAAIQLGKALFWDMQAGSDDIQACASCHFNAGADSRPTNQVNPGQAGGDNTFQLGVPFNGSLGPNYHYNPGTPEAGFGGFHDGDWPYHKLADPASHQGRFNVVSDVNDVSGSQGVFPTTMNQIVVNTTTTNDGTGNANGGGTKHGANNGGGDDGSDDGALRTRNPGGVRQPGNSGPGNLPPPNGGFSTRPLAVGNGSVNSATSTSSVEQNTPVPDPIFSYPDPDKPGAVINTRRTTGRNTPSAVDAVFNYRNFWDGRAQNTCNGANPFGARDKSAHLLVMDAVDGKLGPAMVSMQNSALCSQALGPILNGTEMSAQGRDFHQVAKKLLNRQPLAHQFVDSSDSALGKLSSAPANGLKVQYADLIKLAFLPEWWQSTSAICANNADGTVNSTIDPKAASCPSGTTQYSEMEYNFSLFWGVAIQQYESTLIADQTPFDKYMEGQQTYTLIGDNDSMSYTINLKPGLTPYTISVISLNPKFDFSDQDTFAFDDGFGRFTGTGVDGTVDYAAGTIVINFEEPPVSTVPVKIGYSVGATVPMTTGQLRGLLVFQTKGRCVVCHGGPEFSNAAVDTVGPVPLERMVMEDLNVRVYDTGFYHVGVRPGAEDGGLAGSDPVAAMPLSLGEELRQRVCNDASVSIIVPGRPGDGITQAPLSCNDDIARTGFFKTPQLRNVALTAPYFHNGSQLTLEQVVEFYNRGGDFNIVSELSIMDPDVEALGLGLTEQEKTDLVDFLRTGLTDPRSVAQAGPFDHPQLFAANGHPQGANGYPVQNDQSRPGQATNSIMEIPATGSKGGKPLPTFLENMVNARTANPN